MSRTPSRNPQNANAREGDGRGCARGLT